MGRKAKDIEPTWERVEELIAKNGAMTPAAIAPHFGLTRQGVEFLIEKIIAKLRKLEGVPERGGKWSAMEVLHK